MLDLLGLVPLAGEAADGVNAAWYTAEGDYVNAGLSTASAVPGLGWGAAAAKLGLRGLETAAKGADDVAKLGDDFVVVRGGTSDLPPPGEVFSGSYGRTVEEAGAYVPYGQLRATTAGEIRMGGGTVEIVPEMTRGGNLNPNHVNICLGGSCPFGPLIPNPVPRSGRIQ